MRLFALAAVLALSAGAAGASQAAVPAADKKDVTITGCVVKGEGGYVLMPLPEQGGPAAVLPPAATSGTTAESTSGLSTTMHVLYWLHDDHDLDDHAGQRVEVQGELGDDFDKAEVSTERKDDGRVQLEFKHEGKKIEVLLPSSSSAVATSGAVSDKEQDYEYVVRKVDVKHVKTIASTCQ